MRKLYWLLMPVTLFLLFFGYYYVGDVPIYYFIDWPAMVMILLVLLMIFCTFRPAEIVGYFTLAFRPGECDNFKLDRALHFFRTLQSYVFYMAALTFIMALIYILAVVPDMSNTGPQIAVALITVFYALLVTFFITLPFRASLRKIKHDLISSS